ncbi:MAG TPA: ROK family protein [Steroidobacteraceae bacterium]|nr:ROK family protein [Steroidobacteraceae bacterium]
MTTSTNLLAGVELGGTKCVCILGTGPGDIRAQERVATGEREQTLRQIETILERWRQQHGPVRALGLASFGPIDLKLGSPTYGFVTSTTKVGWSQTEMAGRFRRKFGVPVGIHTDVNGAALAEGRWGSAKDLNDYAYITVGTGVGVGTIVGGRPVFGISHSELGHLRPVRMAGDRFEGCCTFHGDCVEGIASGPAIEARVGMPPDRLAADHPVWESVAHALGQLLHALVLATGPRRIYIGGGVVNAQQHLFVRVRKALERSLAGYIVAPEISRDLASYVVPPSLGDLAGPLGALAIAADAGGAVRPFAKAVSDKNA